MPRTKNRGVQQSFSPSYTIRRWRLGEYIRLSKEDLKKGKDDSNSVKNQRDLLNDFYQKHIEEFESVSEYVDESIILGTSREVLAMQGFPGLILIFIWPEICGPPGRMITKCAKSSR